MLGILEYESQECQPSNEQVLSTKFDSYNEDDQTELVKLLLKPDTQVPSQRLPYLFNIFSQEAQSETSMVCQILGLDNDREVNEVVLGFLFCLSYLTKSSKIKFGYAQFIDESIHL